ncbi:MAG TPA: hypothetical protein VEY12_08205 [Thermoplasmata archaeon]|nr:hypothetical protein [Thermoplasmata archaeon]
MKSAILVAVLLGIVVAGASASLAAPAGPAAPMASATPTWHYTLYGNATSGWGFTPSSIKKPGPILTVTTGDLLALELYSQDGNTHNWTIDVNNDSVVQPTEPHAPNFSSKTVPEFYNLTVTLAPGTYTYRCGIHPGAMWGEIVVQSAPTFVLWGSAGTSNGWGSTNDTIAYPGPTLNVTEGQTVTVDLFSADGANHTFYVDFAASTSPSGNTVSDVFNGTHSVRFTFVASRVGDFAYACGIHGQSVMRGVLHVAAAPTSAGPDYTLYAAVVVIIVIIAIVAVLVIRRKPRVPPAQPPAQPPQ